MSITAVPRRRFRRRGPRRASRAVSDVVATILLLGLTVTLFASIFFFVNTFPPPPAQVQNQFSAALTYQGTTIATLEITHLAGPAVATSALIYITSAAHPSSSPPAYTVGAGLPSGTTNWALGQVWSKNLVSFGLTTPDNLTVSIVSGSQLIFRATLPGSNPNLPPNFVLVQTIPTTPSAGEAFGIYAQISDPNLLAYSVDVNVSQLPGVVGRGTFPMQYNATTGLFNYTVAAGITTEGGTFYVFLNATDSHGLQNSVAVPITIAASSAPVAVSLFVSPATPVAGRSVNLVAQVSNFATSPGNASVAFTAGGSSVGSASGYIGGGSTATFTTTWTPSAAGLVTVSASANVGGAAASGSVNVTVFPAILLLAHNTPAGRSTVDNSSAWLAQELTAAGIPYSTGFVACGSALSSALFSGYGVAIVDFGSSWAGGCPKTATTTDQNAITGATGTNFLLTGTNAFGSTGCSSYTSAFFALFGASWRSGSTCMSLPNATGALTYASAPSVGLRDDGLPSSITVNRTLAGVATNVPYSVFNRGTTNTALLTVSGSAVGAWASGSVRAVAIASEPALFAASLPGGSHWGSGLAGTAVVYNVVDWLSGLTSASSSGRGLLDYGVAETVLLGANHAQRSEVDAAVWADGPAGGPVTVTLYVNGTPALFGGAPVSETVVVAGTGGSGFVQLYWQAPSSGRYTLSVVLTPSGPDYNAVNNALGFGVLNQATNFA